MLLIDPAGGSWADARVRDLPRLLRAGDLLVVNDAATLPASLHGRDGAGRPIELRLLGPDSDAGRCWPAVVFGAGDWRARTEDRPPPPTLAEGETLQLGGLRARVCSVSPESRRLVRVAFEQDGAAFWSGLYAAGRPVQYSHLAAPVALWDVQTAYASRPWAAEMPSAGRPLTWGLLLDLRRRGVGLSAVTSGAGLSATGEESLDARLPLPERFEVGAETARAVRDASGAGGRIVAVGTSVVRALEAAALDGSLRARGGVTDLRIGPGSALRVVDGLLTGVHEPGSSHFDLMAAFAPRSVLEAAVRHAEEVGYLAHEFGDSMLVLSEAPRRPRLRSSPAPPRLSVVLATEYPRRGSRGSRARDETGSKPPPCARSNRRLPMLQYVPCLAMLLTAASASANWPQWRGPTGDGVSPEKGLPLKWTAQDNVAWKLPLPGVSGSTPVVWGERLFLHVAEGQDLMLWCVDRGKGTVLWKKTVGTGNYKSRKGDASSPSPVTDGKSVFLITGTGALKAFDMDGRELWARDLQKDYGAFGLNWGYASSPLLFEGALYVQVLHGMKTDDPSYVLRIDAATGKNVWKVERPTDAVRESPDAYTTPVVVRRSGKTEIVVSGGDYVTGHDPGTGKELWRAGGLNPDRDPFYRVVASPVVLGDLVYVPSRVRPLLAIRAGGSGNVTETHRVWSFDRGPDVPTPVSDGTYLYVVSDNGTFWCLDAKTGKPMANQQRVAPGTYSSSPVLADGRIYVTNEDGTTSVVKAGPQFELLAENPLGEHTLSSPAIAGGRIFIRTGQHLYAIGKGSGDKAAASR
jgi:S-adenosylmethionine:tRNA ribosyltransferase-isomerase